MMKKTIAVMMMVVAFVLLAFTAPAMAEECADKSTGIKHYNMGAYDLAEACFRNYLPTNPDAEVYYYLFRIGLHRDNLQAAFEELGKAGDYYKNIAAAELRQMAIAIGPSNPGRANTLFEEYVKLMPSANKAEITEFFFHLAVDENMKLIVSEETKENCFAFARGFDPAAAEKLISSYRKNVTDKAAAEMDMAIAAGNPEKANDVMAGAEGKGIDFKTFKPSALQCLDGAKRTARNFCVRTASAGKMLTASEELSPECLAEAKVNRDKTEAYRICAERVLGKEYMDTELPRYKPFPRGKTTIGEFFAGEQLPWGAVPVFGEGPMEPFFLFLHLANPEDERPLYFVVTKTDERTEYCPHWRKSCKKDASGSEKDVATWIVFPANMKFGLEFK